MTQRFGLPALAIVSAAAGAGLVTAYHTAVSRPATVACQAGGSAMARLELLFGMARKDRTPVSEADWQAFLDGEVTPRFPDGFTVLAGQGQWRNGAGTITKEASRTLLIWYRRAPDSDAKIEALRAAYKKQFGQESVMRVDGVSCVSF